MSAKVSTPAEIRAHRHCNAAPQLQALVAEIEAQLRVSGHATVSVAGKQPDVVAEVLSTYRRAGWSAGRVSDWRDGDYVEIKE